MTDRWMETLDTCLTHRLVWVYCVEGGSSLRNNKPSRRSFVLLGRGVSRSFQKRAPQKIVGVWASGKSHSRRMTLSIRQTAAEGSRCDVLWHRQCQKECKMEKHCSDDIHSELARVYACGSMALASSLFLVGPLLLTEIESAEMGSRSSVYRGYRYWSRGSVKSQLKKGRFDDRFWRLTILWCLNVRERLFLILFYVFLLVVYMSDVL